MPLLTPNPVRRLRWERFLDRYARYLLHDAAIARYVPTQDPWDLELQEMSRGPADDARR